MLGEHEGTAKLEFDPMALATFGYITVALNVVATITLMIFFRKQLGRAICPARINYAGKTRKPAADAIMAPRSVQYPIETDIILDEDFENRLMNDGNVIFLSKYMPKNLKEGGSPLTVDRPTAILKSL
ncbi:MAG: hypothetical protein WCK65_10355 [Rhodospirillaceae bacterium]